MKDIQKFMKQYQKELGWDISGENYQEMRESLLHNYMLLTTEVAEIAEELRKAINITNSLVSEGMEEEKAFETAKESIKEDLGKELADCLAYMLKFYNFFDINLEESFYAKMDEVKNRVNKDPIKEENAL